MAKIIVNRELETIIKQDWVAQTHLLRRNIFGELLKSPTSLPSWEGLGVGWEGLGVGWEGLGVG
ncbi:hypothetical protein CYANOKiyG1_73160 [Okeania sp. KiyG1]|nr:hypothetical protein CYANOKiyG1_73160 [Okeania sp. KiyG1]